ncbi:hypothetical protein B9Z55_023846 [Caenorhabditis nigoni]|uniref:Major facilitator superfamily (MFS) profile domain-containing protein n=1 Tax=Caenorhabditis nigoni TaxID=1611254 RepID=A0A2G5SRS2_9PELO|nr:hypothetical protein B9Z55_023846 [Caenorhabditis nigoni]
MMNSIMTTTHEIGNALSIIFLLPVSDYKGRKFAAIHLRFGITIAVTVCQLLAAWFQASEIYILGQFILGFTFCLRTFGTQIFILECAPDNCRDEAVNNMIKENSLTSENKLFLKQIWENNSLRQACLIILANMMFMQFDTSYVLSIYTIMFHNQAGFTTQMAMNINLIITIVLFPTKFVATILLDALGRRPTFFIAGIMQYTKSVLILATSIIIYISGSSLITQIMYLGVEFLAVLVPATGVNSILQGNLLSEGRSWLKPPT